MSATSPPEFSVVFSGKALEPFADVAPAGEVRFVLVNQSEEPHDFALIHLRHSETPFDRIAEPVRPGAEGVVACIPPIGGGESETVTETLEEGRYAMISNSPGDTLGISLFELTVQPVEG